MSLKNQTKTKIISHRGAKGLAPENTVAGLQKALDHGADEVEIDIRVTKDKVPILNHNTYVLDGSGHKLPVYLHTLEELRAHKHDLATLDEAIKTVNHQIPLIIEIKPDEPLEPIIEVIQENLRSEWEPADFLLASFDFKILKDLHLALPDIQKVVNERWSGIRGAGRAHKLKTKRLAMNQRALRFGLIRILNYRGYEIYAYTINDPARAKQLHKRGLTGVITDYPDKF